MSFAANWPIEVRGDRAVRLADDPEVAGYGLVAPSPDEAALVPRVAGLLVGAGLKLPPYQVGWF